MAFNVCQNHLECSLFIVIWQYDGFIVYTHLVIQEALQTFIEYNLAALALDKMDRQSMPYYAGTALKRKEGDYRGKDRKGLF